MHEPSSFFKSERSDSCSPTSLTNEMELWFQDLADSSKYCFVLNPFIAKLEDVNGLQDKEELSTYRHRCQSKDISKNMDLKNFGSTKES